MVFPRTSSLYDLLTTRKTACFLNFPTTPSSTLMYTALLFAQVLPQLLVLVVIVPLSHLCFVIFVQPDTQSYLFIFEKARVDCKSCSCEKKADKEKGWYRRCAQNTLTTTTNQGFFRNKLRPFKAKNAYTMLPDSHNLLFLRRGPERGQNRNFEE